MVGTPTESGDAAMDQRATDERKTQESLAVRRTVDDFFQNL